MRTLVSGLEDAFRSFGGVPQELLFDQMKAVITRDLRLEGGALIHNLEFLRFAAHWGFTPRACRPYRAQTKRVLELQASRFGLARMPSNTSIKCMASCSA
jgi:transposase